MATRGSTCTPHSSETLRNISVRISGSSRHQFARRRGRAAVSATSKVPSSSITRSSRSNGAKVWSPAAVGPPNGMIVTSGTDPRCPRIRY